MLYIECKTASNNNEQHFEVARLALYRSQFEHVLILEWQ